jgi:hypothetical protein
MALFKTSLKGNTLSISHLGESISLSLEQESVGHFFQAQILDDPVEVLEVDEMLSRWFSQKLNITCRLVYFPE